MSFSKGSGISLHLALMEWAGLADSVVTAVLAPPVDSGLSASLLRVFLMR